LNFILRKLSRIVLRAAAIAGVLLFLSQPGHAAQKAFFFFQSSSTETVPGNLMTNVAITLTYSNASGTLNNEVFTNGVSITPAGQGVSVSLNPNSPPVADGGGTATLPLAISATAADSLNTTYQIIVSATNNVFTANVPSGIAYLTNTFVVGASAYSNAFLMGLSPLAARVSNSAATNLAVTVTLVNDSSSISGLITNGVTVSGPDTVNVTAALNNPFAALTNNFGQTNLTLSVNVNAGAGVGTYAITVFGTNAAFTTNSAPGIASAMYTLTIFAPGQFAMGIAPAAETIPGGISTNVIMSVTFTNVSGSLTEPLTNTVTVIGPDTANVTAGLNSSFATPPAGGGTAALSLTVTNNGYALPGNYQIIVMVTNGDFSANLPVPGTASVTNLLTINPVGPPSIGQLTLAGTTLEISGSNGLPNRPYFILSSTNLLLPLAQWTPVFTNVFDSSSNFDASFGIASNPNTPGQFFYVSLNVRATNVLPVVASPAFSPVAGPYYAETNVTITSTTPGVTIRYTTDGTTPTETYGTIYTGPVTMLQAVDTNLTGFLTNASGVTMLKAIAYKTGMSDSPIWTGNYEILVPLIYPQSSSPIVGIAHIAYHVTPANWTNILSFWTNYFGFSTVVLTTNFALIKVNDQQFVQLYESPLDPTQFQLVDWGFEVTNAEVYREQLQAAGVAVPPYVTTNALGNLSFFTTDPDGHTNEWVQYLTNSITGLSQGQDMPGTQLFGYINGIGDCTTNETAADNYYIGQCGFDTNQTHDVYIPNINAYIELLTATPGQVTASLAGVHEKAQLLNFQGSTLFQSLSVITNRDTALPVTISVEGTVGTKEQNAADVYDADGSRVRMVDE
jgi:hypothetical protein